MGELLDESFQMLGFHKAQSALVSDNVSNMVAGLSVGGRIPCVCRTMNLVSRRGATFRISHVC